METKQNDFLMWVNGVGERTVFNQRWNDRFCAVALVIFIGYFFIRLVIN